MKCVLDNIIFSLQHGGGISVVWKEHLHRLLQDEQWNVEVLEYSNSDYNILRRELNIAERHINKFSSLGLVIKRFLDINSHVIEPHIFHSSYYRIDTSPAAHNITTVHDFTYEHFFKGYKRMIHSWQKKKAVQRSEKIICISKSTASDLLRFIPGVDEKKIEVVYNGVSDEFKMILNSDEWQKGQPFESGEYLLYVGDRQSKYKQFSLAAKVAKQTNMPLAIVGRRLLEDEVKQLEGMRYHLYSGISTSELNLLYNNAYCLLYPSLYEGFGIPVLEAQRAGCPVIAGANSSIIEIIGNGGIALKDLNTHKIVDAIHELDNNAFRDKVIMDGLSNSKCFSWDNTYRQTLEVYKSLM